jgi:thiol:disulfide interchange protein/DsbC/DsbD-like thiol-disulfide interchange protein
LSGLLPRFPSSNFFVMRLARFPLFTVLALSLAAWLPVTARAHVKATLVAAETAIVPGKPVQVALRLVHDAHWHTYWLNPGTGLVTTLAWTLPPGWKASEIQWPAPKALKDRTGTIVGNGYEDDLLLPVTLTPPAELAPGSSVTLKAAAEWLMCEEVCMPGDAKVSLTLPVAASASPDPTMGARLAAVFANLPRADAAWKLSARRDAKNVTLTVTPATAKPVATPPDLRFFADDNFVAYELPQTVTTAADGSFVLTLPISPDAPKDTAKLVGVLTNSHGWRADGSLPGLRVDLAFAAAAPVHVNANTPAAPVVTAPAAAPVAPVSLLGTLFLAFVGGLILNLMPCVFPVLGIKILGFVNQAGQDKKKVILHGLVFALGVLLSFWALATVLAVLRAGGDQLGWGFQLQSPLFVFALAAVMLIFALNMSGVFEFGLSATGVGSDLQMKSGLAGSFFTGVLATVVATPCSAPFLAPALGAALTLSTVESYAVFTAIAIGLAGPYLLLSIFPAAVKVLPRPGAWMETFKQFMAFPLYATVAYLTWVLAGQTTENGSLMALFGLVLIALGVWFYGRYNAPGTKPAKVRFGTVTAALVCAVGVWTGWPEDTASKTAAAQAAGAPEVVWEKWSPETVAKLRAEGKTIYVDFTARWCATCQTNKKIVFHSDAVLRAFAAKKIVTLRADWTNKDPAITAELAKYQRSAVPFNVIWQPGQTEPVILPELLTPSIVLDAIKG